MRVLVQAIFTTAILCKCFNQSFAQEPVKEYWYPYLADYDGKPGSIIVEMSWFKKAPLKDLPYSFKITLNSRNELKDGLPDIAELTRLDNLLNNIITEISQTSKIVHAGSFAYQNRRSAYNYIGDTIQALKTANDFLRKRYPNEKYELKIVADKEWKAYFEFLYPNEETINFYEERDGLKPLYHH